MLAKSSKAVIVGAARLVVNFGGYSRTIVVSMILLMSLRSPPGNRLEKLSGDRSGQYSIRINDQWRICFMWTDENNAIDVEIVDYH
jgi:toxin HigB-1